MHNINVINLSEVNFYLFNRGMTSSFYLNLTGNYLCQRDYVFRCVCLSVCLQNPIFSDLGFKVKITQKIMNGVF